MRIRALIAGACLLAVSIPVASVAGGRGAYLEMLPTFWANLYPRGGRTVYCGTPFVRYDRRTNVEHVFPMSWVTKALKCGSRKRCRRVSQRFNRIESDMHNLYPALADMNELRGAFAYAELPGEQWVSADCDLEVDARRRRVEPRPAVRGNIARAMLYMERTYGLPLFKRQRKLMLRWHAADPPDAAERRRNTQIERLQGRRNPFIDGR